MYEIIMSLDKYKDNVPGLICMILGCVLATVLFAFVIGPLHNYVKYRIIDNCGDNTPREEDMLRFSYRDNVHPIGVVSALVLCIGFTPPVVYDDEKLDRPTLNVVMFSLAGLFVYLGFAIVCVVLFSLLAYLKIFGVVNAMTPPVDVSVGAYIYYTFYTAFFFLTRICGYSFIFNIIPIIPLDLGDILYRFIGFRFTDFLRNNEMVVSLVLLVVSFVAIGKPGGVVQNYASMGLNYLVDICYKLFDGISGLFA